MSSNNSTKDRSLYWDIVKGISIIAIVLGHAGLRGTAFVYLWHLAIFFFATGYFFNEQKYGRDPFGYFGKRLSGAWPRFMFYSFFFVLMHNWFATHGLYEGVTLYNHTDMARAWLHAITFTFSEQVQGAMWFIPTWLISAGFFAGCVWTGFPLPAALICGIFGTLLMLRNVGVVYYIPIALAVVPFYYLAWLIRRKVPDLQKYTPWYGWIISGIILHLINVKLHIFFDLVTYVVYGFWFYPISLLGIWHVLCLAGIIDRNQILKPLSKLLAILGTHSFDIMALHFTIFKLVDFAYARYILHQGPEGLSGFPLTFREIGIVHVILGITIPVVCGIILDRIEKKIN